MDHLLKKEQRQKFKETGDSKYIFQNELGKACFQHDMAYGNFKDLPRRTAVDKAFNIAKNPNYDGYQLGISSMVYKFFIKSRQEVLSKGKLYRTKN